MKILVLGPHTADLLGFLTSFGDDICTYNNRLETNAHVLDDTSFIVSYGYRYILGSEIVERFNMRIINLHVSYLPWNRGADPNLWSFLENTPKGVTIHYIDQGIDTGPIIVQREVAMTETDTLRSSYERLHQEILKLFEYIWPEIRSGRAFGTPQPPGGGYHKVRDRNRFEHLLKSNWDTPVRVLIGKARPGV